MAASLACGCTYSTQELTWQAGVGVSAVWIWASRVLSYESDVCLANVAGVLMIVCLSRRAVRCPKKRSLFEGSKPEVSGWVRWGNITVHASATPPLQQRRAGSNRSGAVNGWAMYRT